MPNINKIFGLFDDGKNSTPAKEIYIDFMSTPEGKIGMFMKLINNNIVFNEKIKAFFKKVDGSFDEIGTKKSSEFTVFNRAWYYIKDIDIDKSNHLYALTKQNIPVLLETLKLIIRFFEEREEYEKCAHLHKIYKITNEI